jgi:5-methylcytosine-specific restriction protein B
VITGDADYNWDWNEYRRFRPVKWLVKGIHESVVELNNGNHMTSRAVYWMKVTLSDALEFLKGLAPDLFEDKDVPRNHVFIIDEINRGNISKIFGELITLIEPGKRIGAPEELRARLPYSGSRFGVPGNVYLLGTMNTADRSIAMIDTALRRRFRFVEMQPDSTLLSDVSVEGIDLEELLDTMNRRITVLLDREHTIGHSFFLPLKDDPTLERLASIFEDQIVPLLQEYFYDDYEKIQLVLGDDQKADDGIRFIVQYDDGAKLFKNADLGDLVLYEINREAFKKAEAYGFFS